MWVEFVVGSRLALGVFLRVLRFSTLHKKTNLIAILTRIEGLYEKHLRFPLD